MKGSILQSSKIPRGNFVPTVLLFITPFSVFGLLLFGFWEKNQENPKGKSAPKEKAENTTTLLSLTFLLLFPRSQTLPFGPLRESSILINNQGFCCFLVWLWCLISGPVCVYVLSLSFSNGGLGQVAFGEVPQVSKGSSRACQLHCLSMWWLW